MNWRPAYALAAALLLAVELVIAIAVHDSFVRPYLGDSLAVLLVYAALCAVTRLNPMPAAALAFCVAALIECGQLIGLTTILGLEGSVLARTLLGTGFDPKDFLAYAGGALAALTVEALRRHPR
jgi:hypothetical protein